MAYQNPTVPFEKMLLHFITDEDPIESIYEESAASYAKIFEQLKERGLKNVWLVVSDGHKGLVNDGCCEH